jgi:lactate permease
MIPHRWIIVASIFLYNIACETGQFQVMKDSIAGLSSDKRLQLVLIAFCFGAFLEGTGGGGAPVAIAGAFLIGLGFNPFQAATLCLIANTAPVAWGGVGNPIRVLAGVTGLPEAQFSAMTGASAAALADLAVVVGAQHGRLARDVQVWPALFVSGLSFAGMQFYWSNFQESGLVDVVSAIFSLLVMVAFLKFWKPKEIIPVSGELVKATKAHSTAEVLKGWSPFIVASILIFITGLPSISKYLTFDALKVPMPLLHNAVLKMPPVAPQPTPEDATVNLNFIGIPGTAVFIGGIIAGLAGGHAVRTCNAHLQKDAGRNDPVFIGDQLHGRDWPTSRAIRGWTRFWA